MKINNPIQTRNWKSSFLKNLAWIALLPLAGLAAGSFFDLQIAQQIFHPGSGWASWFAVYGPFPAYIALFTAGSLFLLASEQLRKDQSEQMEKSGRKRDWLMVIGLLCAAAAFYMAFAAQVKAGYGWAVPLIVSICTVCLPGWFCAACLPDTDIRQKIRLACYFLSGVLIAMGITQTFKHIFLRPRYLALQMDSSIHFQPWWIIGSLQPLTPAKKALMASDSDLLLSFSSGHTASAALSFLWLIIPFRFEHFSRKRFWFIGTALLWTVLTACSRMVLGYHFLSDVSAGMLVALASCCFSCLLCFHAVKGAAAAGKTEQKK